MEAPGRIAIPAAVALRPTLVATVVEDGAVLLDLETKYFYDLNESAWAVVQLVETAPVKTDEIVDRCAGWGARDETALRGFLCELLSEGVIEEAQRAQALPDVTFEGAWTPPAVRREAQPLQSIVTSAFDPSIPLAE